MTTLLVYLSFAPLTACFIAWRCRGAEVTRAQFWWGVAIFGALWPVLAFLVVCGLFLHGHKDGGPWEDV